MRPVKKNCFTDLSGKNLIMDCHICQLFLTHTVYFSSSLNILNQKPMIHRTDFHCITTWVVL